MRRTPKRTTSIITVDERGNSIEGTIQLRDLRWLYKLMRGFEQRADRAYPKSHFRLNLTTTEVNRVKRIADTLGWHIQHLAVSSAGPAAAVPRGNPEPETPK